MKGLVVKGVDGKVPMNIVTGVEFEEAIENLAVLMRTAGALGINADIDADGEITITITDKSGNANLITMEAEEL